MLPLSPDNPHNLRKYHVEKGLIRKEVRELCLEGSAKRLMSLEVVCLVRIHRSGGSISMGAAESV